MIQNREPFLNHIAQELGRPRKRDNVIKPQWKNNQQWKIFKDYTKEELIEVLKEHCKVIHTSFKRTDKENLPAMLKNTIEEYGSGPIITAKDERNIKYGLTTLFENMLEENIEVHEWDETKDYENVTFAERANIGITFSDITLAESGTVTLFNDKNNSRTISLLPTHYIAIIPKETIVPRMSHATWKIHELQTEGED